MKTIAHFLMEEIKVNQRFIYNQIVYKGNYNSIVIGPFEKTNQTEFPFENFYNINKIEHLAGFFAKHNVVAIHAHHGKHAQEILPLAIQLNIPVIISIRGSDGSTQTEKMFNRNFHRYRPFIEHEGMFLPVCHFLADELRRLHIPNQKIHVLYGGIDLELFPYKERRISERGSLKILTVGRLVQKKGHDTLIKAFKKVKEKYEHASLTIIGTGKEEANLSMLIEKLQLTDSVFLTGKMDLFEIAKELQKADIFCLPSETAPNGDVEGIPNAIKEAMACGLPVISTNHGGIPELISHLDTGYLVCERNVAELTKAIEYMIEHPEKWLDMTYKARKVIEDKFDLKKQLVEQHRLYSMLEQDGKQAW